MVDDPNGGERKAVMIYISQEDHARLKILAAAEHRSMNAQATLAVEQHLAKREQEQAEVPA